MRHFGPLLGLAALACATLTFAQPTPTGDQPIVPNPAAPPPETSSPSPSPAPSASPSPRPAAEVKSGLYISDTGNHRIMYMKDIKGEGRQVLGRPGKEPGYFL